MVPDYYGCFLLEIVYSWGEGGGLLTFARCCAVCLFPLIFLYQAMYHFLSGYTAKVAGTERGVTEPTPNFSACFGAAFLTLHPTA